jgi:hypothetical protein
MYLEFNVLSDVFYRAKLIRNVFSLFVACIHIAICVCVCVRARARVYVCEYKEVQKKFSPLFATYLSKSLTDDNNSLHLRCDVIMLSRYRIIVHFPEKRHGNYTHLQTGIQMRCPP